MIRKYVHILLLSLTSCVYPRVCDLNNAELVGEGMIRQIDSASHMDNFHIGGLGFLTTIDSVRKILGKPTRETSSDQSVNGELVTVLYYPDAIVNCIQFNTESPNTISKVLVCRKHLQTPFGVYVGMSFEELNHRVTFSLKKTELKKDSTYVIILNNEYNLPLMEVRVKNYKVESLYLDDQY